MSSELVTRVGSTLATDSRETFENRVVAFPANGTLLITSTPARSVEGQV